MREIKFRGMLLSGHGWTIGDLLRLPTGETCIWFTTNGKPGKRQGISCQDPVNAETIGQYTGLKDKNGVEIYEGDILAFMGNRKNSWAVEFGMFLASDLDVVDGYEWKNTNRAPAFNVSDDEAKNSEVIGNIYENPELVK